MKLDVSGKLQFSNYASIARVGVGTSEKLWACMGGGTIHDNKELVERRGGGAGEKTIFASSKQVDHIAVRHLIRIAAVHLIKI